MASSDFPDASDDLETPMASEEHPADVEEKSLEEPYEEHVDVEEADGTLYPLSYPTALPANETTINKNEVNPLAIQAQQEHGTSFNNPLSLDEDVSQFVSEAVPDLLSPGVGLHNQLGGVSSQSVINSEGHRHEQQSEDRLLNFEDSGSQGNLEGAQTGDEGTNKTAELDPQVAEVHNQREDSMINDPTPLSQVTASVTIAPPQNTTSSSNSHISAIRCGSWTFEDDTTLLTAVQTWEDTADTRPPVSFKQNTIDMWLYVVQAFTGRPWTAKHCKARAQRIKNGYNIVTRGTKGRHTWSVAEDQQHRDLRMAGANDATVAQHFSDNGHTCTPACARRRWSNTLAARHLYPIETKLFLGLPLRGGTIDDDQDDVEDGQGAVENDQGAIGDTQDALGDAQGDIEN